jgi:hypothetical protein
MDKFSCDYDLYYFCQNGKHVILVLYVEDLVLIGDDHECISWLETKLCHKFDMTFKHLF